MEVLIERLDFALTVDAADTVLTDASLLRSGTTCFLDMGAQNDAGLTARAAASVGMRGVVGRHAADRKDSRLDPALIGARRALRMATIEGARALGWTGQIGSLEAGKQADCVLFDLNHHEWTPYGDPLQALVWSASPASIDST